MQPIPTPPSRAVLGDRAFRWPRRGFLIGLAGSALLMLLIFAAVPVVWVDLEGWQTAMSRAPSPDTARWIDHRWYRSPWSWWKLRNAAWSLQAVAMPQTDEIITTGETIYRGRRFWFVTITSKGKDQ